MSYSWADPSFLCTPPEDATLEGPLDLGIHAMAFQPPRHKPYSILAISHLFGCFLPPWSKNSSVLALAVVRGQPINESDCQKLYFVYPRLHKSYTGVFYLYASPSALPDILNLIFLSPVHLV